MHFDFGEDQRLFQRTVRDFLEKECTPARVRGLWQTDTGRCSELWKKLAELGICGLRVPQAHEGMGMDEVDFVLLLEEAGRAALAEPVIVTAAVGVPLIVDLGSQELSDRWLKAVVVGEAILAVGHPVSSFVSDAHVAQLLLLAHADELHAVPRDEVSLTRQVVNDPSRRIFSVEWNPSRATRVATGPKSRELLAAALDRGALGCAAQALGVTERLVEMAVAYARQREQFGKPIGSFQAVKHMLADIRVRLEYARPLVYRAAHSVARSSPRRGLHVSMAKAAACETAIRAGRVALQVHGAIGYTWEQDLHIWMRRAWSLEQAWGLGSFHRKRVSDVILEPGAGIGPGETFA